MEQPVTIVEPPVTLNAQSVLLVMETNTKMLMEYVRLVQVLAIAVLAVDIVTPVPCVLLLLPHAE
jgi:hypothetical protein